MDTKYEDKLALKPLASAVRPSETVRSDVSLPPVKITIQSKSGLQEIEIGTFNFSSDWKSDYRDIMVLEKKAFPKELQSTKKETQEMLGDKSVIAVVAKVNGHIIGMAYGLGWPFVEKEPEDSKAEGGEKESFEELPKVVEEHIRKTHPEFKLPREKTFYVHSIAVLPDFQRQNIGTNLAMRLISEATRKDYAVFVGHAMVNTGSAGMFESALGTDAMIKDYFKWYDAVDDEKKPLTARLFAIVIDLSQKQAEKDATSQQEAVLAETELKQSYRTIIDSGAKLNVPMIAATNGYNCGPTVLKALLTYYGFNDINIEKLEKLGNTTKKYGTFPEDIVAVAEKLGFKAEAKQYATIDDLVKEKDCGNPSILLCTIHDMVFIPGFVDIPEKLWYGWQDALRHIVLHNGTLRKLLRPLEVPHYLVLVNYDKKNLTFVDVTLGKERHIPKDEFEKIWFGEIDRKRPATWYRHWMMTVSKKG